MHLPDLKLGEGWRWLCRSGWRVKNKQTKGREESERGRAAPDEPGKDMAVVRIGKQTSVIK